MNELKNKDVVGIVKNRVESSHLGAITQILGEEFLKHEDLVEDIHTILSMGNNMIIQGDGGFGKSDIVNSVCKQLELDVNYLVCNESTTVSDVLGPIDINNYLDGKGYERDFEKGVFRGEGVLVIEEAFDAPADVITAIKDVMSRKKLVHKNGHVESLVSNVILITNVLVEDLPKSPSISALLSRFVITHTVDCKWSKEDYYNLLSLRFPFMDTDLVEYLSMVFSLSTGMSPRKALDIAPIIERKGTSFLNRVLDLKESDIESFIVFSDHRKEMRECIEDSKVFYDKYVNIMSDYTNGKKDKGATIEMLTVFKDRVSSNKSPDSLVSKLTESIKSITSEQY